MNNQTDIALLTDHRYTASQAAANDWYFANILRDDALLREALADLGLSSVRVDWADPAIDWTSISCAIFRTTWDYFERITEFTAWLDRVEKQTRLCNDASLIRWNLDKHYLADLESSGIPIVPSLFLEAKSAHMKTDHGAGSGAGSRPRCESDSGSDSYSGPESGSGSGSGSDSRAGAGIVSGYDPAYEPGSRFDLSTLLAQTGWEDAIIKPCISGAARHTYRINRDIAGRIQKTLEPLFATEAFILQPFLPDVLQNGEDTLILIDGTFTHAVTKKPKPGDFRVQDDHGGTVHTCNPTAEQIELAERSFAACRSDSRPLPVYGRVDMVRDQRGVWRVMELELIEPELWLRNHPPAARAMAQAIARFLKKTS